MVKRKLTTLIAAFVLLTFVFSHCAEAAGEKIFLVSHGGVGNPFWGVVFNGAKQAAKDLNVDLHILFPNKDADQAGTTQKLREAISTHPAGIAVTLATPAHCEHIKQAVAAGISVIAYNARAVKPSKDCPYEAYVGMDEYQAGRVSAAHAFATGRIKGRVVVGVTEVGHAGIEARAKGISDELKTHGIKVDVVDLGSDAAGIGTRFKSYYQRVKSDLSGMFMPNPLGMHGVLRLMQEDPSGIGKLYAASFDLTPLILTGIAQGQIEHTIDQQPYLQGYYAVAQLTLAARAKFTPIEMNTGVGLVTQANAAAVADLVKQNIR